jgi:hypothetical protein
MKTYEYMCGIGPGAVKLRLDDPADRTEQIEAFTIVNVRAHTSEPGAGLTYPAFSGMLIEECNGAGWDVVDVQLADGSLESVYSFSVTQGA